MKTGTLFAAIVPKTPNAIERGFVELPILSDADMGWN